MSEPVPNPSEPPIEDLTPEEIARHYAAYMPEEHWPDCLERNKQHLKIMLAKKYWTTEDLEPLRQAAA